MSGGSNWQSAFGAAGRVLAVAGRWLAGFAIALWLLFGVTVLALRYLVLPDIGRYRENIEVMASEALGTPVRVAAVSAGWEALRPELFLDGVAVLDRQGRDALSFRRVEVVLSWRSLFDLAPRLHRLSAEGPTVIAERLADRRVMVAGFQAYPSQGGDPALADWLLHQRDIVIANARVVWRDAGRPGAAAEELVFSRVDFRLENRGDRHRFAFLASPPQALAGRIDLRGDFDGRSFAELAAWQGRLYLSAPQVDLGGWRTWLAPPVKLEGGRGSLRLWAKLDRDGAGEASADLALADLKLSLAGDQGDPAGELATSLPPLDLTAFQGRLGLRKETGAGGPRYGLSGLDLALALRDGTQLPPTTFGVQWSPLPGGAGSAGVAVATELELGRFVHLSNFLPIDRGSRDLLQRFAPEGAVRDLNLSWRGDVKALTRYSLNFDFARLGMRPVGLVPGFEGLSGRLKIDEGGGQLELASRSATLDFPAVFPEPRVALRELKARAGWTLRQGVLEVNLEEASFVGPDGAGNGRGRYRAALAADAAGAPPLPGEIELTAKVRDADATAVWRYLPHLIAADVRQWVKGAVRGGKVGEADLVLRGPLARFPFADGRDGQFLVKAQVTDGRLLYAPGWPEVTDLHTDLRFEGESASFAAEQASTAGVRLGKVKASIDRFSAPSPKLGIQGDAQGPVPGFTRFLDQSPLGEMLGRFYETVRVGGDGRLRLGLDIPLDHPETAKVSGDFDLIGAVAHIDPLLPPVTGLNGRISFTDRGAEANALSGQFFGRPLRVDLRAHENEVRVAAFGEASAGELQRQYRSPLLAAVTGVLPWQAAVSVRNGQVAFAVQSSLVGLVSTLPEPFGKAAEDKLPVSFARTALVPRPAGAKPARPGRGRPPADIPRDQLRLEIGDRAGATLIRRLDGSRAEIERGIVAVGDGWAKQPVPEKGLKVAVQRPRIDLDAWRTVWNAGEIALSATGGAAPLSGGIQWPVPEFELKTGALRVISREWTDVAVTAVPQRGGIGGRVEARDMAGDWSWNNTGKGMLRARLKQLVLPESTGNGNGNGHGGATAGGGDAPDDLPALDVVAEQLVLGERRLGRLEVQAENAAGKWKVPRFALTSPDGEIVGQGSWTPANGGVPALTEVDLAVKASDVGRLLVRFGYPDAVRRGEGTLNAQLSWRGVPTGLHLPSLNGRLDVRAERGQFNKLEPGIGKLLSLLSLQMLPRRIALDFRDVFSDGFAFEKISGNVGVTRGDLITDNLEIDGSAARVLMTGHADLANDRVDARVVVQPELGSTLAIGTAMVVNPVVGVATLLAQKLLQDPLNKAFAFEYAVSGALSDPRIERISAPPDPSPGDTAPNVPMPPASGK